MVGTNSAKMTEIGCKLRKAVADIAVTVLIHTYIHTGDKIKASYDIMIGSTTMMLDTYDGMVTSVTAVPEKALLSIDSTPLRKTVITHTAHEAMRFIHTTHAEIMRETN